jgi:hypothetical protein
VGAWDGCVLGGCVGWACGGCDYWVGGVGVLGGLMCVGECPGGCVVLECEWVCRLNG